jgi:hypothetical protein
MPVSSRGTIRFCSIRASLVGCGCSDSGSCAECEDRVDRVRFSGLVLSVSILGPVVLSRFFASGSKAFRFMPPFVREYSGIQPPLTP